MIEIMGPGNFDIPGRHISVVIPIRRTWMARTIGRRQHEHNRWLLATRFGGTWRTTTGATDWRDSSVAVKSTAIEKRAGTSSVNGRRHSVRGGRQPPRDRTSRPQPRRRPGCDPRIWARTDRKSQGGIALEFIDRWFGVRGRRPRNVRESIAASRADGDIAVGQDAFTVSKRQLSPGPEDPIADAIGHVRFAHRVYRLDAHRCGRDVRIVLGDRRIICDGVGELRRRVHAARNHGVRIDLSGWMLVCNWKDEVKRVIDLGIRRRNSLPGGPEDNSGHDHCACRQRTKDRPTNRVSALP
jgi:hypothetical protein